MDKFPLKVDYPLDISSQCATSKSPLLIVQHPFHGLKQDV